MFLGDNKRKSNDTFQLFDSEKLADLINHDISQLRLMEMYTITRHYDCFFLEDVLNRVELLADIDRFVGIIKIYWRLDVTNKREGVVYYNPKIKEFVPYIPDFPQKIDQICENIRLKRELKRELDKKWEEWEVSSHSKITQTATPDFSSSDFQFIVEGVKCIKDLDVNVQAILNITNDNDFAELIDICQNEIWPWLQFKDSKKQQPRPKKDANVIRFVFRYYGIVDEKCSVHNFTMLFNAIVPEAKLVEDTVSSREDANIKPKDFYKFEKDREYYTLRNDSKPLYIMLEQLINKIV